MDKIYSVELSIKIVSEANIMCHWSKRHKRNKRNAMSLLPIKYDIPKQLPCVIRLTRLAPRKLDSDNLAYAFKGIRDTLADFIKPGLAPGRADDKDINFEYAQEYLKKDYAIRIEVLVEA